MQRQPGTGLPAGEAAAEPAGQPDLAVVWQRVCAAVRARVGDHNFDAWIAPLRGTWAPDALVLEVSDATSRTWILRHFAPVIEGALAATLRRSWPIRLELAQAPPPLPIRVAPPPPGHTFDTFVVGESNALAHAAARAVLGGGCTPLFLHGPVGVGKTHLLHAIFHALDARGTRAACLPAAQLVASLVQAYRGRSHDVFWHDLAPLGGLLLDDVHSLAGQEEVQERLVDGLVAWVEGGRLLVLTSDRAPADLPELAARLRDRFRGDLIARIEPPEPALRVAILQQKARSQGVPLDAGLAGWMATRIGGNVRRLEGALTRLAAHARLLGRHVDQRLAEEVLPELALAPAALTVDRIVEETAAAFGAAARALRGRSRRAALVLPRQVAMYLARELLARPFAELAKAFARDHTTVLHAWRSVADRLATDPRLAGTVRLIERRLGAGGGLEGAADRE
jgi:chromosomal replication initiator protein